MPTETKPDLPLDSARVLMNHLREHPADVRASPTELAGRLNLSAAFVAEVLGQAVQARPVEAPSRRIFNREALSQLQDQANALADRATARPLLFLVATTFLGAILIIIAAYLAGPVARLAAAPVNPVRAGLEVSAGVPIFALHMLCYYRRATARVAVYGGIIVFVATTIPALFLAWRDPSQNRPLSPAITSLFIVVGFFVLSAMYIGIGSLASVLGGWVQLRRDERAQRNMTRQELLERYFELQSRLETSTRGEHFLSWESRPAVQRFRRRCYFIAAGLGFTMSFALALTAAAVRDSAIDNGGMPSLASLMLTVILGVGGVVAMVACAFIAGSPARGAAVGGLWSIGSFVANVLPGGYYGSRGTSNSEVLYGAPVNLIMYMFIGACCGAGALVQQRAVRNRSLQRNDQSTILGEMVRIQWELNNEAQAVCVMVVDAAKSSEMKAAADPLVVEYSFREYQSWLEELSQPFEGRVHSTAGDGAVVAFPDCHKAISAARRIQTDLDRFNREDNRLDSPFRLRIGLHTGEVSGDIDKVQFTEVIDIAAHIQSAAPVGGIGATDSVVAALSIDDFIPLATPIDGHSVYLARNPTED